MTQSEEELQNQGFLDRLRRSWEDPDGRKVILRRILILLVVLLALPKVWPSISKYLVGDRQIVSEAVSVDLSVIGLHLVEDRLFATGNILANQEINLSSEVSGLVVRLNIEEGEQVNRGQLLVKINDNDLQAQLKQAQYALEVMTETAERQRVLFERGGSSQEEYDASRIQLNRLKADVELLEAQIQRTEIRAPFRGVLGLRYINVGSYITPSSRIATLQDLSSVRIDFSVPERYATRILPGTQIRFSVQGVDSLFTGTVFAIEPQIDTRTRTIQVRAAAENREMLLRPGAFANIDVVLDSVEEALLVPSIALIPDMGAYRVLVYEGGLVQSRPVTIGTRTGNAVQITSGLVPGDSVLTSGLLQVQEGAPVSVSNIRYGL